MTIRTIVEGDRDGWLRMRDALWPNSLWDHDLETRAYFVEARTAPVVFVAEIDGRLVGFLELDFRKYAADCTSSPVPFIEGWYVEPAVQRQGIGRALVEAAEAHARAAGFREMASDAEIENTGSHAAHGALGYEEVERTVSFRKTLLALVLAAGAALTAACASTPLPTQPTALAPVPATLQLEGERGSSNGQVRQRLRASGGQTLHLAPGEHLIWAFAVPASPTTFALSVTYSNGKEGPNELLAFKIDGAVVTTFVNRDSGDAVDGWNTFITDPISTSRLGSAIHTLTIESSGGDGCVEIDKVTLVPSSPAGGA